MFEDRNQEGSEKGKFMFERRLGQSSSIMPGLVLIAAGLIFMAQNLLGFKLDNWWAFFILIPAGNHFVYALRIFRCDASLSRQARFQLLQSFFFVLLSAAFLFSFPIAQFWPVFLIMAGLGLLLGAF